MARSKLAAEVTDRDGPAAFASLSAGHVPRAPEGKQSTSLTLRPLLAPFKGRGRLFLRIEKMPQRATLSAGKRNSDGSWSLASDELDDLTYQVPAHAAGDHALTVRVTALDGGEATTLKVLDLPVSFSTAAAPTVNEASRDQSTVASQLGQMQSLFALREAEIERLRTAVNLERRERERDAELMREGLQKAFDERLAKAAAQHQQELEAQRTAFQAQIAALTSRVPEPREKEHEIEGLRQQLQKEFEQHQEQWDAERAVLQAEIVALAARADAAERRLREEQQSRQADAGQSEQKLRATYDQQLEAAQRRQEDLSRHQLEEARRAAAADAEANLRIARERWATELAIAVQQAREDWDGEQAGLIEKLREEHDRHCHELVAAGREKISLLEAALAKAAPQDAAPDHSGAELQSLKDQLAAARRLLADRERDLSDVKAQLAKAEQKSERAADRQEDDLRQQLTALQAQAEAQIASLTARCREAESRASRNSWGTAIKDKARIDALTLEVAALRTALAKTQTGPQDRSDSALKTAYNKSTGQEEEQDAGRSKKSLLRDFCIAVCCITPLILFYPRLMSVVHQYMSDDAPTVVAVPKPAAPQAVAKTPTATVVRGVNMHKTASAQADVVATLKKGASVEILSMSGKWMEVGIKGRTGAGARGWVYSTYLRADGPP